MKAKLIFAAILMGSIALAADPPVSFARNYAVGDKDVYAMNIKMAGGAGDMSISMTSTEVVKKVYDNGDADVETTVTDLSLDMMGQHMKPPSGKSTTARRSKYGMPTETAKAGGKGMNMSFMKYAYFTGDGELTPGKAITIDHTDPDNPKNSVKGTTLLVGTENGVSKITSVLDITTADTGDKPMHVVSTTWIAGAKMIRAESVITNFAGMAAGPMKFDSINMTIERKN